MHLNHSELLSVPSGPRQNGLPQGGKQSKPLPTTALHSRDTELAGNLRLREALWPDCSHIPRRCWFLNPGLSGPKPHGFCTLPTCSLIISVRSVSGQEAAGGGEAPQAEASWQRRFVPGQKFMLNDLPRLVVV